MSSTVKNKKSLFKSGFEKQPTDKVVIGGADLSDLPSKELLIDQKVNEAKEKAINDVNKIIEEAEAKAAQIIEDAISQKDNILDSAREEGCNQGYAEGINKAKAEFSESLKASNQILEAIEQERQECIEDETQRIYKVICLIAKKLIRQDLAMREDLSLEFINQALKKLEYKSEVNLLINPILAKKINQLKAEIIDSCPGLEGITITASEAMAPGDLILESNKERLDFRIDSQLDELIKEICR